MSVKQDLEAYCKNEEERGHNNDDYEGGPLVPRFTLQSVYYPDDGPLGVTCECVLKGCEPCADSTSWTLKVDDKAKVKTRDCAWARRRRGHSVETGRGAAAPPRRGRSVETVARGRSVETAAPRTLGRDRRAAATRTLRRDRRVPQVAKGPGVRCERGSGKNKAKRNCPESCGKCH